MPREIFVGPDVAPLFSRAQARFGPDAVVIAVRRVAGGFALEAADAPSTRRSGRAAGPSPARLAPDPMSPVSGMPLIVALIGATGSGKTTTIAKLANHPEAYGERTVGLLCLDTYRVGAVEQLGLYAELSRLPVEVVHETRQVERALRRLRECDVVLVDTAGRGPRAEHDMAATRAQLDAIRPDELHLTLPAGLHPRLARRFFADLHHHATHVLVTKLDEFPDEQVVFELAESHRLPVRWCTDGQEVPRDLRMFDPATRQIPAVAMEV